MLEFLEKFIYTGFVGGDYEYGIVHIASIIFVVLSIVILVLVFKARGEKYINKIIRIIAIISLSIYFLRRLSYVLEGDNFLDRFWPFYLCNINTIFYCLYEIFHWKKGKDFFIVTGLLGGIFTFLIPDGIFVDKYITLGILDSIMSHYVIVVCPLVLLITKTHILKFKNIYTVFIGLLIALINVEVIQPIIFKENIDYLFLRGNIPFSIPGVPQFLIISSLTVFLIILVYFLDYLYIEKTFNLKCKNTTK